MTGTGREECQGQTKEEGEPEDTVQPPPNPLEKDTQTCKEIKRKDEDPKRPIESKPLEKVVIHDDYPDQTIIIGGNLSAEYRFRLIEILRKHTDAFAWTPTDMTVIPCVIAEHELKTYPHIEPKVQRKWAPDRRKVVKVEVNARATYQRLVDTIFEGEMERNLEAYVDDMFIKSKTELEMIKDVKETLLTLKKWGIELEAYGIKYSLRSTIKGQVLIDLLADRMAEDSSAQIKSSGPNDALAEGKSREEQEAPEAKTYKNLGTEEDIWKLYTDGASNKHGSGEGLILIDLEGAEYSYVLWLNFANSNNDAEYEGLQVGLRIAAKIKVNAIVEEITRTWMTPTQEYIEHGILPEDAIEARTIQEKARNYTIEEGVLYPKSYLGPLLRCIGSNDEIPPPPSQTPTQQASHTVSTIKLLILKKGEYDIWAMKMEHYLGHTDYPIWEVIQKGNGHVQVLTDTNGQIKFLPPKTAEEILARKRERKARTTLLMAKPEDHLAKIHKMIDAKEMTKPGVDTLSFDDLYNNFRVFESDVKGSTTSSSRTHNVALVSSKSTSSTYEASTAYGVSTSSSHNSQREGSSSYNDELMYSFFANQSNGPQLDHKDLEWLNEFDLEEMDLK
nr:hypothetical protein [Tanacetum cinerariifolium]